jgi:hypothetical protein
VHDQPAQAMQTQKLTELKRETRAYPDLIQAGIFSLKD